MFTVHKVTKPVQSFLILKAPLKAGFITASSSALLTIKIPIRAAAVNIRSNLPITLMPRPDTAVLHNNTLPLNGGIFCTSAIY
jgi:hypothetical protein